MLVPAVLRIVAARLGQPMSRVDREASSRPVSRSTVASLYGLVAGAGGSRPIDGLVPAIVSDVRDPLKLGRVKLTFPWLAKDFTSGWARTVQFGAGQGCGALVLPEIGDEVLVGFVRGDLDEPYVLGGHGTLGAAHRAVRRGRHVDAAEDGKLLIEVRYTLRDSNDPRNLVFPFYVIPAHEEVAG